MEAETRSFINAGGFPVELPVNDTQTVEYWTNLGLREARYNETSRNILDGFHITDPCFIVGSGPSLKGFDYSQLEGKFTIAVNRASENFYPMIAYTSCMQYYNWMLDGKVPKWRGEFTVAATTGIKYKAGTDYVPFVTNIEDVLAGKGVLFGKNSGLSAITLAIALGSREIYLLGMDMKGKEGYQTWCHDGYPKKIESWANCLPLKYFGRLAKDLEGTGVKVYNCSDDSALTCFEHREFRGDEILKTQVFMNKDGKKSRLPIEKHCTDGQGAQFWFDKGWRDITDVPYLGQQDLRSELGDNAWEGRRCFIVGGGPSLKKFDWSKLDKELVIAVNRSFEKCNNPEILFSGDPRFWQYMFAGTLGDEPTKAFDTFEGLKVGIDRAYVFPESIKTVPYASKFGWSFDEGVALGLNSGFAALNLAVLLGANPIYLLGFDMRGSNGKQTWHHDGYPTNNGANVYPEYIKEFERIAPELAERGIEVINLNKNSSLKCFKKEPFPEQNMAMPLIVAHYTEEYEGEVREMEASCAEFGLEYETTFIEPQGGWRKNSNMVARHIRDMLEKHDRPILRIDADARIRQYPILFTQGFKADYAAHLREGRELLGGTLYFNNTDAARELLDKWIEMIDERPVVSNQVILDEIRRKGGMKAKFRKLPKSYTKIWDTMDGEAVIEHLQKSRVYRKVAK